MLTFFIIFTVTGLILGFILDENKVIVAIIIISILWAFAYGPWAIATFVELLLGYGLAKLFNKDS